MELRKILEEYRDISLELINLINNDDKKAELLIERRENLLEKLKGSDFSKEKLRSLSEELQLVEIEKKIIETVKIAKGNVRREIVELKKQKDANKIYGSNFKNINFINKKI